jgi:hypothetical protein
MWEISNEQLEVAAMENTVKKYPYTLNTLTLNELIANMIGEEKQGYFPLFRKKYL